LIRIPFKINKVGVVQLFYGHPICQGTLLPKRLRSQLALLDPGFTDQYDQRRYGSSRSVSKMVGKMKQPEMHTEKFVYNQRVRNLSQVAADWGYALMVRRRIRTPRIGCK
jgi:hypothetical protein